jgi:conjugative transfer signal peptidase TraF
MLGSGQNASFVGQDKGSAVLCRPTRFFRSSFGRFRRLECSDALPSHSTALRHMEAGSGPMLAEAFSRRPKRLRAPLIAFAGAIITTALLAVIAHTFGLMITMTDSASPAGVYRLASDAPLNRGALVAACLPISMAQQGLARGYLGKGDCPGGVEPVAKLAAALPGDVLQVERGWVAVNGDRLPRSQVAARDSAGRTLPHVPWGRRTVAPDEVWLFGFHDPKSWDGRYFGPVPTASVCGVLKPVVTW